MVEQHPWARVKNPRPLPDVRNAEVMARTLDDLRDDALAILIRDHLLPPATGSRQSWNAFWSTLGADQDLRERASDILNDYLDAAEDAAENLVRTDDRDRDRDRPGKRIDQFFRRCQQALDRIFTTDPDALIEWAGPAAAVFNPPARAAIDDLVKAIARHEHNHDDEMLYATLDEVLNRSLRGRRPKV